MLSKLKIFSGFLLIIMVFIRCDDDIPRFPYVYVNETIYIDSQLGNMNVGEVVLLDRGGYGGLVIYRSDYAEYLAFDRACTHDYQEGCILEEDENFESLLECPCCGSKFIYGGGGFNVFNGPARRHLEQYDTYLQGANVLRVTN